MNAHELDCHLYKGKRQHFEIETDGLEAIVVEAGSNTMMNNEITMDTIFRDGSSRDS